MRFRKVEGTGNKDGGIFLKIKDGESVTGVFRGEVYEFQHSWEGGPPKPRFKIGFVTKEGDKWVAKVWEFSATVNNMLYDLSQEYDLSQTAVKITRTGVKMETSYSIIPVKAAPPMDIIAKVPLHPLNVQKKEVPQGDSPWAQDGEELPF